jgi:catechol 2,3-dioxygenase-like lactoylglutathione lyase family enzyme
MLQQSPVRATLPVADMERAKRFYAEKLGLTSIRDDPAEVFYECGSGSILVLFPSRGAPSGTHTQAKFDVTDIVAEVAGLKAQGVVFEDYDLPQFKSMDSIVTMGPVRAAWFRDTEGNLLALAQSSS